MNACDDCDDCAIFSHCESPFDILPDKDDEAYMAAKCWANAVAMSVGFDKI